MNSPRQYLYYFLGIIMLSGAVLGAIAVRTILVDPYWLWRQKPAWVADNGGHNRILDRRMRHAKSLQVVTRRAENVILGSSRVYRGFDTTSGLADGMFNMGISSLRIAEAEKYVSHLVKNTPVKRLILGLEYFMFDADQTTVSGFDMDTGSRKYLLTAFPAALITLQAWNDASVVEAGLEAGDGFWRYNGFKTTADRDAAGLEKISSSYKKHRISQRQYDQLGRLMDTALGADLDFILYLSPMSEVYLQSLKELGEYDNFIIWRQTVASLAKEKSIKFKDLSVGTPFSSEEISDRSTVSWIDASHFKPVVGEWILQELAN